MIVNDVVAHLQVAQPKLAVIRPRIDLKRRPAQIPDGPK